jgi:hypothetical protein
VFFGLVLALTLREFCFTRHLVYVLLYTEFQFNLHGLCRLGRSQGTAFRGLRP